MSDLMDSTPPAPSPPDSRSTSLGYRPALDGLRAISVLAVMLLHTGFTWMSGGFLGVSTFFTLSGFLITTLLLREHERTGHLSLRGFYARRLRRLMPASLLTLLAISTIGVAIWTVSQMLTLRGDVLSALFYVANWHFILSGQDYASIFAAPSPVQHFWSLAIEEQFYIVFPLLLLGILTLARRNRRIVFSVLAALAVISTLLCAWFYDAANIGRAYYGTDTRAAELLLGALAAVVFQRGYAIRHLYLRMLAVAAGCAALVFTIWSWVHFTDSSAFLYRGGFALYAFATCCIIVAALQPGPVRALLSVSPLVALGKISYGVYLVHWPIFLWLTPARTGLTQGTGDAWLLFALRSAVSIGIAVVSYYLVENPIRRRRRLRRPRRALIAVPVAVAVVAGTCLVVTLNPAQPAISLPGSGGIAARAAHAVRPQRVLVIGDSVAQSLLPGLVATGGDRYEFKDATTPECAISRTGVVRDPNGVTAKVPNECDHRLETWTRELDTFSPDVILLSVGASDTYDRQVTRFVDFSHIGEPSLDTFLEAEINDTVDTLTARGTPLVWLTTPPVRLGVAGTPVSSASIDRWNQIVRSTTSTNTNVHVAEFGQFLAGARGGPFLGRPDGNTFDVTGARRAAAWILPALAATRPEPPAPPTPIGTPETVIPPGPNVPPRTIAPGQRASLLVVGDSVAFGIGWGLKHWGDETGRFTTAPAGKFECAIARGGTVKYQSQPDPLLPDCDWSKFFPDLVQQFRPDVVALATTVWETADRLLPGETKWRHLGQPEFDAFVTREIRAAVDVLGAKGARVVLILQPYVQAGIQLGMSNLPESEPARMDRLNEIMRTVAAQRPNFVSTVDLQAHLRSTPGGEMDLAKRPDGVHFSDAYAIELARWLGPILYDTIPKR